MKIKNKLFVLGAAGVLALVVVVASALFGLNRLTVTMDEFAQQRLPALVALGTLREGQVQISRHTLEPLLWTAEFSIEARNEWGRMLQSKRRRWDEVMAARESLASVSFSDGEQQALEAFDTAFAAWAARDKPLTELLEQLTLVESEQAQAFLFIKYQAAYSAQEPSYDQAQQAMQALAQASTDGAAGQAAAVERASRRLALLIGGVGALAILSLLIWAWHAARTIVSSVERMRSTLMSVSADLDFTRVAPVDGKDEVSDMGRALNTLLGRVRQSLGLVHDLSEGMQASAHEVSVAAAGVAGSSAQQSESAATMAASVQELAASMKQVTESVTHAAAFSKAASAHAVQGGELIDGIGQQMERVAQQVGDAAGAMAKLGQHGKHIRDISTLISNVARETNLLALNAAIEAARAGEGGRGFAVVAEQVRELAEQTAASSSQIAKTVESIASETSVAMRSMQEVVSAVGVSSAEAVRAGDFMRVLKDDAEHAATVVAQIGQALAEQSLTNDEVAQHVDSVAAMACRNGDACGLVAQYAERMRESAQGVDGTVKMFRVS